VFVANHDTERVRIFIARKAATHSFIVQSATSLNASSPSNVYTLATVFSLAHPYGTPTVLSSYSGFEVYPTGAPNNGNLYLNCTSQQNVDACTRHWDMPRRSWHKRLAVPTPLDARCRDGRLSQSSRLNQNHQVDFTRTAANCI
jgi:hypothetical protein